jgi:hypothetical protein
LQASSKMNADLSSNKSIVVLIVHVMLDVHIGNGSRNIINKSSDA